MTSELAEAFPQLCSAIDAVGDHFARECQRVKLPPGQFICLEGQSCSQLALVVKGSVRVYKSGETGREITLYRVSPGGSCILTASCILNQRAFPAFAVAETEVEGYVIPAAVFQSWVEQHPPWRNYVFQLLSDRLESVIEVLEEVAFRRMDSRLAAHLLEKHAVTGSPELRETHEMIAADLGSSREVISRLLKDFEREGLVRLGRGQILILDTEALEARRDRM
ncbi:MAG: Crp/Fnr family transcriptional regulator [Gammaproteobacteria bacterium]